MEVVASFAELLDTIETLKWPLEYATMVSFSLVPRQAIKAWVRAYYEARLVLVQLTAIKYLTMLFNLDDM